MNKTDLQTLKIFWHTGAQNKRDLWLSMFNPLGAVCLGVIVPLFIGKILAALATPNGDPTHYIPHFLIAGIVGVIANRIGFNHLMHYQARTMGQLQYMAMNGLLKRSAGFHNNNIGGKLVSDAIDYPAAFSLLCGSIIINMIPFLFVMVVGTTVVLSESLMLGLITLIMSLFAVGSGIIGSRRRAPLRIERLKYSKKVTSHLADTVVNIQTVKTFAREDSELKTHEDLSHNLLKLRLKDWWQAGSEGNYRIAVLLLTQLLFVFLAIKLVGNDPSLLGIGIFAFSFSITISNRLFEINTLVKNVEDGLLQASPMTEILNQQIEIQDVPNAKNLKVSQGSIDLQNIKFEYQDSANSQNVFEDLNLSIKPGEKIGLVGPSGGGKSTLTRLLLRFDDVQDGQITIDEQNIALATQQSLRQAISYVPQEPLLFHRSIQENIAYGNPKASLADVKEAASQAHAHEFITGLANGYNTIVGERGVKLSGGQRQRIAIARAILKDAPILVLDEATSALDSESEKLIQDALWQLMKNRTAIVIAHRLSTIQKMDRIIVLDNGKIIETGSHLELLAQKGIYAKLWAHQSGGFIQD